MEHKIKALLVATGIVVGSLLALTPLTSYASNMSVGDNCLQYQTGDLVTMEGIGCVERSGNLEVLLNVQSLLILDAASGDTISAKNDVTNTGKISANVRSSHDYTISLSSTDPALTNPENATYSIPASNDVTPGINGWGVKKDASVKQTTDPDYSAITSTPTVFYEGEPTSLAEGEGRQTDLEVGVGVSPVLPAGTYSTTVTVTAAFKE